MAQTAPTKSNLMAAQKSLRLAKLGYELLDRKKNILMRELMLYTDNAKELRVKVDTCFGQAYEALKQANLTLGRCTTFARSVPVDDSVTLHNKNVMGMMLPEMKSKGDEKFSYFGLSDTNGYLDIAYKKFSQAKTLAVKLAAVESDVCRLADAIKKSHKRANALNNIQIPRLTEKIKAISEALDEKEREDFSRLKQIKK